MKYHARQLVNTHRMVHSAISKPDLQTSVAIDSVNHYRQYPYTISHWFYKDDELTPVAQTTRLTLCL